MRFAPLKSATLAIVATAIQRLVVIVAFVWLSRTMAQDIFGAFSFLYAGAVGYASVVLMPASQSFGAATVRHGRAPAVANFYLTVTTALAVAAALAYYGFVRSASGDEARVDADSLAMAVVLVPLLVVAGMFNTITFASGSRRAAASATLAGNLAGVLALWALSPIVAPQPALGVFVLISTLGGTLVLRAYPALPAWRAWPEAAVRRTELRQLLPLVASACLGAPVHALCLSFLLHAPDGLHDIALFNAAFQFYGLMIFVPGVLAVALMPYFSTSRRGSEGQVGLRNTLLVNLVVGLLLLAPFVSAPRWLSTMVFGPDYAAAAPSVVLLSLVGLLYGLSVPCLQWLITHKRSGEVLLHSLAYSLTYILAAYWTVGRGLGHLGLSAAFLGATVVLLMIQAGRIYMLDRHEHGATA